MDVVWLKRDVRLHDHGPLHFVCNNNNNHRGNTVCLLYLYEPDQLSEPSVHGTHIALINDGLMDFDQQIMSLSAAAEPQQESNDSGAAFEFRSLTVCHGNAIPTLQEIHSKFTIRRLLAHEETGHFLSYQRDRKVRKWCKEQQIPFLEFQQSGVTRRLQNRDDFSKKLQAFLSKPQCNINLDTRTLRSRIRQLDLSQSTRVPMLDELTEIPLQHRVPRPSRQKGGERAAHDTLQSFLHQRGEGYSAGVSSPLSSWTTCSRLSVFLAWGHISLRRVYQATKQRQEQLKQHSNDKNKNSTETFRKSLAAFQSRLHWRSHFIQKLESEPLLEKHDLHPSYQQLRRQPGDWNEAYYQAWSTGHTGFPFVDACMRCLLETGWLNFRMRAMLVSFATYNLWLDWKRIAPHLARLFADFEPGIHYPQLQMQAGTTGINAMRVYNVIKQGQDHDPEGIFVKRYVPELQNVPKQYIHEPWKMSKMLLQKYKIRIHETGGDNVAQSNDEDGGYQWYLARIVDAQESAKVAKAKIHAVRQQDSTKQMAKHVYEKHGSRTTRRDGGIARAQPAKETNQPRIQAFFTTTTTTSNDNANEKQQEQRQQNNKLLQAVTMKKPAPSNDYPSNTTSNDKKRKKTPPKSRDMFKIQKRDETTTTTRTAVSNNSSMTTSTTHHDQTQKVSSWNCTACTFENDKPLGLACIMCGTHRK